MLARPTTGTKILDSSIVSCSEKDPGSRTHCRRRKSQQRKSPTSLSIHRHQGTIYREAREYPSNPARNTERYTQSNTPRHGRYIRTYGVAHGASAVTVTQHVNNFSSLLLHARILPTFPHHHVQTFSTYPIDHAHNNNIHIRIPSSKARAPGCTTRHVFDALQSG